MKQTTDAKRPDEEARTRVTDVGDSTAASSDSRYGVAGQAIGPFRLIDRLGRGGMGEVWLAEQTEPVRRRVALKVIAPGTESPNRLARFASERQALALMEHPHIAKIYEAGVDEGGRPYIAMEYVDGPDLGRHCLDDAVDLAGRLRLFRAVCLGVHHAHQRGVIHRDLKPSNVVVARADGRAVPKVIDFGLAKGLSEVLAGDLALTRPGTLTGTLEYAAPEQLDPRLAAPDVRSDVFSLGAILYQMLTGSVPQPCDDRNLADAAKAVRDETPERPSVRLAAAADAPVPARAARGELDWVVMKCLEKDPDRRYESAAALADDVGRLLRDEPVRARPASAWYQLRKAVKRHRVGAVAACLVLASLAAGLAAAEWQRRRAERALAAEAISAAEARAERDAARAVTEFLREDLLALASPQSRLAGRDRLDPDARLRDLLDRAARRLAAGRLADAPRAEAEVRATVGNAYLDLGEYDRAVEHLARAAELARRELGSVDPRSLRLQVEWGWARHAAGDDSGAIDVLRPALADARRVLGGGHAAVAQAAHNLAVAVRGSGDARRALPLARAALAAAEESSGVDHPLTLQCLDTLATTIRAAEGPEAALPIYERAQAAKRRALGDDHADTLAGQSNLAGAARAAGDNARAIELYADALARMRRHLSPGHPYTLTCMSNLALAKRDAGDAAGAVPLLEAVLKAREASLGATHPYTLTGMNNLAVAYEAVGRREKALPLYRRALRLREESLGRGHRHTLISVMNLATAYYQAGAAARALPLAERAATTARATLGENHPYTKAFEGNAETIRDAVTK